MAERRIGLLGATSLLGTRLIPQLVEKQWRLTAFSRTAIRHSPEGDINWRRLNPALSAPDDGDISVWLCLAPIWVLPDYLEMLKSYRAKRVVALSSTSRFSKISSSDAGEQRIAERLAASEALLQTWSESNGIEWVVLRPTLIYGYGKDKNIAEIARFIMRFGFFPLLGKGAGLRQPVHAEDVAAACVASLTSPVMANRAYNLSGGETLAYRDMVIRIFTALQRRPRLITVPLAVFRLAIAGLRLLPRFRQWSPAMAERMNQDLVFDPADAGRDFGFSPRPFRLADTDLPDRP